MNITNEILSLIAQHFNFSEPEWEYPTQDPHGHHLLTYLTHLITHTSPTLNHIIISSIYLKRLISLTPDFIITTSPKLLFTTCLKLSQQDYQFSLSHWSSVSGWHESVLMQVESIVMEYLQFNLLITPHEVIDYQLQIDQFIYHLGYTFTPIPSPSQPITTLTLTPVLLPSPLLSTYYPSPPMLDFSTGTYSSSSFYTPPHQPSTTKNTYYQPINYHEPNPITFLIP